MRLSISTLLLFFASVIFTGCGAAEPGSTVTDDTPAGQQSPKIDDPDDPQMGDEYIDANK